MDLGKGGACVPARVALQGRIHRSFPTHNVCIFGMEIPLRRRSDGHTGTAPTVSFGWSVHGWLISLERMVRKWLFCLCEVAWENMMEIGMGGACVPARVAPQGRIRRSSPRTMRAFWHGNAAVRTFGRAHRRRPYGFVWADYA